MHGAGELDAALEEVNKFSPWLTSPTPMEMAELENHNLIKGKIHRWRGCFSVASGIFYNLLETRASQTDQTACTIISHLVGSLTEQKKFEQAERVARQAVANQLSVDGHGLKRATLTSFKLLQLALAETLMCRSLLAMCPEGNQATEECTLHLQEAERIFIDVEAGFWDQKSQMGLASKLIYLRACVGSALSCHLQGHWIEAQKLYIRALEVVAACNNEVTDFLPVVLQYCHSHTLQKLDRCLEANAVLHEAKERYPSVGRQHWWTGLGTFLLDWLRVSIPDSGIDVQ